MGSLLIVGVIILGGIWMLQQGGGLGSLFPGAGGAPPMEEAPPAEGEPEPEAEPEPVEEEPEPVIEQQPFAVPVPVFIPATYGSRYPGYSRQSVCSEAFGGSCNSECRHGPTRECLDCSYFCGPPHFRGYAPSPRPRYQPPRPRPRPHTCPPGQRWSDNDGKCVKIYGGPGPRPRQECPRGQRYDWTKKKCMPVPKPPKDTPKPEPTPTPTPTPSPTPSPVSSEIPTTTAPASSNYVYSYYGGW